MFVSRNQMHILCIALSSDDNRGITDTRYLMAIHIRVKNVGKKVVWKFITDIIIMQKVI